MGKYLLKRILFSIFAMIVVTGTVMALVYTFINRQMIFKGDEVYSHYKYNDRSMYEYNKYQKYGYLTYENGLAYINAKCPDPTDPAYIEAKDDIDNGDINNVWKADGEGHSYTGSSTLINDFITTYKNKGYFVKYLAPVRSSAGVVLSGGSPYLVAINEYGIFHRLGNYLASFFQFETVNDVQDDKLTERYIRLEWDSRSNMPALVGSGTTHKYLIYFDNRFPFIHQNFFHINLGTSSNMQEGSDTTELLNASTGRTTASWQQFPKDIQSGNTDPDSYVWTSNNFHTATYTYGDISSEELEKFTDRYTTVKSWSSGLTAIELSFSIGIIATIVAYIFGLLIGVWMSLKKDKIVDKIGNIYIIFIMAVPSLAYIFIFATIGTTAFGLPYKYADAESKFIACILPCISLALPSIAGLMKWMRRYMIDQMNSDYVKFARSQGLSEGEIFTKHVSKNAFVFLVHSIPADILGALTGAIITESVYGVPGVGRLLTDSITAYDNGVIVGTTVFYTFLTILAMILGDLLLAKYDPRISLTEKK